MRATNILSLEVIDFQSDIFFKEIAMVYEQIATLKKDKIADSSEMTQLTNLVRKRTGLNKLIFHVGDIQPSVEIPKLDNNNVLINNFIRAYVSSSKGLDMVKNASEMVRGSVNLKTGIVSGIFSEVESTINMPLDMLSEKKFTAEEKAAITLHEIGHLETYYEFMSRTVTTNQILAGISKGLDESGTYEERETILIAGKKALKLKDLDVERLCKSNDKRVVEMVILSSVVREASSEIGNNIYDFSAWEQMADQFATRMGAGRALTTALDKIYRSMWNISYRNIVTYLAMEAIKVSMVILSPPLALLLFAIDGAGDGTYDRPGARIKRIRNQLIEQLKLPKLKKELIEIINTDIKAIDSILENIEDRRQFVGIIWDTLIPSGRRAYSQEKLQQQLEAFASNELFKRSAEFKNYFN